MSRIYFSRHATFAMEQREVTVEEVEQIVRHPEVTYGSSPRYPAGTKVLQAGDVAVVLRPDNYNPADVYVVTVLWRQPQQWTNEEMKEARNATHD